MIRVRIPLQLAYGLVPHTAVRASRGSRRASDFGGLWGAAINQLTVAEMIIFGPVGRVVAAPGPSEASRAPAARFPAPVGA